MLTLSLIPVATIYITPSEVHKLNHNNPVEEIIVSIFLEIEGQ